MSIIHDAEVLLAATPDMAPIIAKLKDHSIPLDDRWDAYTMLVEGGLLNDMEDGEGGCDTLEKVDGSEPSLYDDFSIDRYHSITFPNMAKKFVDYMGYRVVTEESEKDWKELVLTTANVAGFTHDW